MTQQQFKVGDKVQHTNPQVPWKSAIVVATHESDSWNCVPGMVRVNKGGDAIGVTIPISLLKLAEDES